VTGINWIGQLQPQNTNLPPQPGGCSSCHPTLGPKPNPIDKLTEADYKNVDCLLCHGPDYKRTVAKTGEKDGKPIFGWTPAEGVDVLAVAQKAQAPTSEMCLRCHAGTGGGPNAKHGVIPTQDTDVHLAAGVQCVNCHVTEDTPTHKIAGGSDLKAQELPDVEVACSNCHTDEPHKSTDKVAGLDKAAGEMLNDHIRYIACQTCHIPAIARDPKMPTVIYRDWATSALNEKTGLYGPKNEMANDVMPEYHWWNGTMTAPPEPLGSRGDGLITPWKRTTYNVPVDAATDKAVYIKAGVYNITGDIAQAVAKGVEDWKAANPDFEYSGNFEMKEETMVFSVNHQVAPAADALACESCHAAEGGRLDFALLGYTADEVAVLTTFPPVQPEPTAEPTTPPPAPAPTEPAAQPTQAAPEPAPAATTPTADATGTIVLIAGLVAAAAVVVFAVTRRK
jgi:hypothetical protein